VILEEGNIGEKAMEKGITIVDSVVGAENASRVYVTY